MTLHNTDLLRDYEKAVRGTAPKPDVIPVTEATLHPQVVTYRDNGKLKHIDRVTLLDWLSYMCFAEVIDLMPTDWLNTMIWLYQCDMAKQRQPFKVTMEAFDYNNDYTIDNQLSALAKTYPDYQDVQEHDTDANAYAMRNQD